MEIRIGETKMCSSLGLVLKNPSTKLVLLLGEVGGTWAASPVLKMGFLGKLARATRALSLYEMAGQNSPPALLEES